MARGGLYKSDVEKARNGLLAQGKHPSVDAVRVALGNTGSKTTIHRYLKELEAEDAQGVGGKHPISEALTDLVSRLAGRLNEEADTRIAEAKAQFEVQLRERTDAFERQKQEAISLSAQLQRMEVDLQAEKASHASVCQAFSEATGALRQMEERLAGLMTRLSENEAHAQSLEEKHQHAREALEHYRTSVKEQREQDQRRHEHQLQEHQVALRHASDAAVAKNQELLQLNRDNVRLTEQSGQLDRELRQARKDARDAEQELQTLRPLTSELEALRARWAQGIEISQRLEYELEAAIVTQTKEHEARQLAETSLIRHQARLEVLEEMLGKLGALAVATNAAR